MADLVGWEERQVTLATQWKCSPLVTVALVQEPWAIHAERAKSGDLERRLSHLPTGCSVVREPIKSCAAAELADLAARLNRLGGIDWSSSDEAALTTHRKRVKAVIRRWSKARDGEEAP